MRKLLSKLFGVKAAKKPPQRPRFRPCLEALEDRLVPAPIMVNSTADDPNGPVQGQTTLRDAINQAVQAGGAQTIEFTGGGLITLKAALPSLNANITIQGPTTTLTVDGAQKFQIFNVPLVKTCAINDLVIQNGANGGGKGGGIDNEGTLTMKGDTVQNCKAANGGGIYNGGTMTLTSVTVQNNNATDGGGGIESAIGGLTMNSCIIYGNTAASTGGGLYVLSASAPCILTQDEFLFNKAQFGGGVSLGGGKLTLLGGSVQDNTATDDGGGIYNQSGTLTLQAQNQIYQVYVENNTAGGSGGGLILENGSTTTFNGCTIENNSIGPTGAGKGYFKSGEAIVNEILINNPDGHN